MPYKFQLPLQHCAHYSEGKHDAHLIVDANGNHVCRINHDDRIDPEEIDRIVALFTAAPELLAQLEKCRGHVAHYGAMPHAHSDAYRDAANANAAIRKATTLPTDHAHRNHSRA